MLKDERARLQKRAKPKTKSKAKRGRPPAIDIDAAFKLKAEVSEEKQKTGLLKDAIASLIEADDPHSWWWDKNAPVKLDAADRRYHRAVKRLEDYMKKHGQAYEPMSLAKLGERAGIKPPEQPPKTIRHLTEDMLDDKLWLYERKDTPSQMVASKRNFRRLERGFVKDLKEYAASIGKKIAMDGPKHPAEKVKRAREHLKALDAHIADFEEKLTKIESGGSLILLGKPT